MAISTSYRNMSSFLSSHAASLPRGCAPGRTAQTSTVARVPKHPAPRTPLRWSSSACGRGRAACAASSGQDQIGVVIVDHGSKKQASNEMLEQFAEVFDLYSDYDIVESAHMEIAEPTILQASEKCIQRGATSVVITPYFLSRGRHIQKDIPAIVKEARETYPDVKFIIADPIGVDPLLAQLMEKRVASALEQAQ